MDKAPRIVIVDYGCGNLFSIQRALLEIGVSSLISRDPDEIRRADKVILPGVGAFGTGMNNIRSYGLKDVIAEFAASGKFLLGICLGMQLLMRESYEFGHYEGLHLIAGKVTRLQEGSEQEQIVKIPHVGWNELHFKSEITTPKSSWLGLQTGTYVYFLHSFYVIPDDPRYCMASVEYGANKFCAIVQKNNIMGVQFHPEISGPTGLKLLKNFVFELKEENKIYAHAG